MEKRWVAMLAAIVLSIVMVPAALATGQGDLPPQGYLRVREIAMQDMATYSHLNIVLDTGEERTYTTWIGNWFRHDADLVELTGIGIRVVISMNEVSGGTISVLKCVFDFGGTQRVLYVSEGLQMPYYEEDGYIWLKWEEPGADYLAVVDQRVAAAQAE